MSTFAAPTRKRATKLHVLPGIAVSGALADEHLLGRQAMYSLPDEPRPGSLLMRSWSKHGLDVDALPEARQKVDVFRSACASVKQRVAFDRTGQRIEILANEVTRDGTAYQITVRRWDLAKREIEHEKAMRVEFDRRTNAITLAQLEDFDPAMGKLLTAIQEHFDSNATTVPGQKVRNAIRQTLLDIGGQNLRRKAGGVYFVPTHSPGKHPVATEPILEGLAGVLEDLYGDRADFDIIRWANDEGERAIVRKHFGINATDKATELAEKAWTRVRQGRGERGVRSDLISNLENERRSLLGQVKHFEELVGFERQDIAKSLAELDDALDKLDKLANEPAKP